VTDRELINRKLSLITGDLEKLDGFREVDRDDYLADMSIRLQVERLLERIINRLIDINFHIASYECDGQPTDYYDSFIRLAQTELYGQDEAKRWASLAGLRNRLTHEYNGLDQYMLFDSYQQLLEDLPDLLQRIQTHFG
jgi:uncharacterized protein YutE (UPF0331/DUF86 family)